VDTREAVGFNTYREFLTEKWQQTHDEEARKELERIIAEIAKLKKHSEL
jgi:hypothetical protein